MKRLAAACLSLGAASAFLTGCGDGGGSATGSDDPIKIVISPPSTGSYAELGQSMSQGWEYAVQQANDNGGIDGHEVELIKTESDFTPAGTVRAVQQAVVQNRAQFVAGILGSNNTAAVAQQLRSLGVVMINDMGQDGSLTGTNCVADMYTVIPSFPILVAAVAAQLDQLPGTKWAVMAPDYSTGHSAADAFAAALDEAGKPLVSEQFAPLGTTDFGPYISKVQESGADAIYMANGGSDEITLMKQLHQYGLDEQLDTIVAAETLESMFTSIGDELVGTYSSVMFDPAAQNPLNEEFVAGYTEEYGAEPSSLSAMAYLGAQTLFAAIEESGSIDPEAVGDALDDISFDSIAGPVQMRPEDHQLLLPVYLGQIAEEQESVGFDILETIAPAESAPEASQECQL